jgi:hypothetical protein
MRFYCRMAIVLCTAVAAVSLGVGQQPGGGLKKGLGPGSVSNPASLFNIPEVREELKLTDEQLEKVPDAVLKGLAEVLSPAQLKRLKQINLQVRGADALTDRSVQKALKMTNDQVESVRTILADSRKEMTQLRREMSGAGNIQAIGEKMMALRNEAREKAMGVLNPEQKRVWKDMTGEEFKLQMGPGGKKAK